MFIIHCNDNTSHMIMKRAKLNCKFHNDLEITEKNSIA